MYLFANLLQNTVKGIAQKMNINYTRSFSTFLYIETLEHLAY